MTSLFSRRSVAAQYARGRPYYHDEVIRRVERHVAVPVGWALDVGCGPGQSTEALRGFAERIVGIDASASMIAEAKGGEGTEHIVAAAESVPFADGAFDLVTVSSAFHWLDRERFLPQARRVLKPGGALVIYENWFTGRMQECSDFERWSREVYASRYPMPPRNRPFSGSGDDLKGFRLVASERYGNVVAMTRERFVDYLLTQTNVTAASEGSDEGTVEIRAWIENEVGPFFHGGSKEESTAQRHLVFGGVIWCLARVAA